jgi:hypothetical protein
LLASQSNKTIRASAANSACPVTLTTFSSSSKTCAHQSHGSLRMHASPSPMVPNHSPRLNKTHRHCSMKPASIASKKCWLPSLLCPCGEQQTPCLLVALSAIAARQAQATVATEQAVNLLLNYVATYPNIGIVYRASDMILCAHADVGFLNKSQSHSRAGARIYLSKNDAFPRFNGAVLSIAQIIKFVMASAAESELAALFIAAREMILHRQTLIDMGWPQPKSPIQTDNSTQHQGLLTILLFLIGAR